MRSTETARLRGCVWCALLFMAVLVPARTQAQGWIEPRPGLPGSAVEKLRTSVSVRITRRVAEVEVQEWFRNNGSGLGEGDYVYPLPAGAVFSSYSLYQGEQELRGEMMDADRARDIYESIVRARKDPALIELIGKGMVRARVFPIEAGQTRRITMRYTQQLDRAGDALQFRYAAGARHIGAITPPVRRPGLPAPDGDVSAIRDTAPLTFTLVVEDAARFRDAFSPTHGARVSRERGRMTVQPQGELTGDFAVFLPLAERAIGLSVAAHRPVGEDGYFMLTLSPGDVAESRVPRDVTVVVDVSGSMSGEKMQQAQRALQQLLGTLGADDRIRLIAFSNVARPWRAGWTRATRTDIEAARDWVDNLRADGGTNIHEALTLALREKSPADRLPIVVFMTDGLPTNGETRAERIADMAETERGRARVFAFGLGFDVNTYLLDRLSAAARGATQYVRPDEDVEEAVSLLASRVRHPVLTDLQLEDGSLDVSEVYPRELPDVFAGQDLVLFGRYRGAGDMALSVSGRRGDTPERYTTRYGFPREDDRNDFLPRLWASRKLGDLDRRIRSAQADGATRTQIEQLIEELRETALRYGLLSEYTSYLVQEPGVVANLAPPPAAPMVTGQAAVVRAEEARRAREVASVADMQAAQKFAGNRVEIDAAGAGGNARVVAGRTFLMKDGVWMDTRHADNRRTVEIRAYSEAYFALLRALPETALVLRELDDVLIAGTKVSLKFGEGGAEKLGTTGFRRIVSDFR